MVFHVSPGDHEFTVERTQFQFHLALLLMLILIFAQVTLPTPNVTALVRLVATSLLMVCNQFLSNNDQAAIVTVNTLHPQLADEVTE